MGVNPEGPEGVVEVEDEHFGERETVSKGLGEDGREGGGEGG